MTFKELKAAVKGRFMNWGKYTAEKLENVSAIFESTTTEDVGKVLTVGEDGSPEWGEGGGGSSLPPYGSSTEDTRDFNGIPLALQTRGYVNVDHLIFSKGVNFSATTESNPYIMIASSNLIHADEFKLDRRAKIDVLGYNTFTNVIFELQGMPAITCPITVEGTTYVIGVAKTEQTTSEHNYPIFACGVANALGQPVYGLDLTVTVSLYAVITSAILEPNWIYDGCTPPSPSYFTNDFGKVLMADKQTLPDGRELLFPAWRILVPKTPSANGDYCLRVTNGEGEWVQINS